MQTRPAKIIVLSLDYDGCGSHLFGDDKSTTEDKITFIDKRASSFLNRIKKFIADASTDNDVEVHVYVGSARQDISTDEYANKINNNGSCFENYRQLCDAEGWTFQPLLLADKHHNLPSGTAIKNKNYHAQTFNVNKVEILQAQMDDITSQFPNTPVVIIVIDDDPHDYRILDSNANHFKFTLPENITLKLVQYQLYAEAISEDTTFAVEAASETPKTTVEITSTFIEKFDIKSELSFDPTKVSGDESAILNQLLLSCVKNKNEVFYPAWTYAGELNANNKSVRKQFKLTGDFHALYFRHCATTSYGYRFEIISDQRLGQGAFGIVFNGTTTLTPQNDGSLSQKTVAPQQYQARVHKYTTQTFIEETFIEDIERMHKRNTGNMHARHLHVKQMTLIHSDTIQLSSFTAMRKMPGKDLWTILKESMLNTQQSITLALSILYAYRDQLDAYQLVHGDIKPDNVLITYTTPQKASFIDFDFCKPASSPDHNLTGASGFHPPELLQKNHGGTTPQSDMYALGITIGEIFFVVRNNKVSFYLDYYSPKPYDITEDEQISLRLCIEKITHAEREKRCSIDEAIKAFEQLALNRLPDTAGIQQRYEQAASFGKSMRDRFAGKPASTENIINFLEQFITEVSQHAANEPDPDLPAESKQFIATAAGVAAFPNHTKMELLQLASGLLVKYQNQVSEIQSYLAYLARITQNGVAFRSEFANTVLQINQFIEHVTQKLEARSNKYSLSLEHIQIIYNKSEKEKQQLIDYCNAFKNGLSSGGINHRNNLNRLFKPVKIERQQRITLSPNNPAAAADCDLHKDANSSVNFNPVVHAAPRQPKPANKDGAVNMKLCAFTYPKEQKSSSSGVNEVDCYSIKHP